MKKLPTSVHGVMDYFFGLAMLSAPAFGKFSDHKLPAAIFFILGVVIVVYSIFTRYEHGPFGIISVKTNLKLDMGVAAFVLVSPFLFGFSGHVIWTNMLLGGMMMATALMSETETAAEEEKKVRPLKALQRHDIYRLYGRSRAGRR
jgi:Kef-type K+ transport system membrane component KefB